MPSETTVLTMYTTVAKATVQARRHGGHFVAVPPKSLLLPPSEKCAPQASFKPQKKVTGPVPRAGISSLLCPPKSQLVPSKSE